MGIFTFFFWVRAAQLKEKNKRSSHCYFEITFESVCYLSVFKEVSNTLSNKIQSRHLRRLASFFVHNFVHFSSVSLLILKNTTHQEILLAAILPNENSNQFILGGTEVNWIFWKINYYLYDVTRSNWYKTTYCVNNRDIRKNKVINRGIRKKCCNYCSCNFLFTLSRTLLTAIPL